MMEGATKVKTSEFASYMIENMDAACDDRINLAADFADHVIRRRIAAALKRFVEPVLIRGAAKSVAFKRKGHPCARK